jgi:hypothetical protein
MILIVPLVRNWIWGKNTGLMMALCPFSLSGIHFHAGNLFSRTFHAPVKWGLLYSLTRCRHLVDGQSDEDRTAPSPGIWHVNQEEDAHHMSLVPLWTGTDRQKQWWRRLGQWLASVEESR